MAQIEQRILTDENVYAEGLENITHIKETALIIQRNIEQIQTRVSEIEVNNNIGSNQLE